MPFTKCQKCGKRYSDKAPNCPFCGSTIAEHSKVKKAKEEISSELNKPVTPGLIFTCVFLAACWFGYTAYTGHKEAEKKAEAAKIEAQKKAEKAEQERREERIARRKSERAEKQAAMTPAELRQAKIRKAFSPWDGSHRELTRLIKKAMNDPDSYQHAETRYVDMGDHLIIITTFRGKNKFGGMVKNRVKAKCDIDGNVLEIIQQTP